MQKKDMLLHAAIMPEVKFDNRCDISESMRAWAVGFFLDCMNKPRQGGVAIENYCPGS